SVVAGSCSTRNASTRFLSSAAVVSGPYRSSGTGTTRDVEHLSGNEPGALAHEERGDMRDVVGRAAAADRDGVGGRLLERLPVNPQPGGGGLRHVGGDEAGGDRVDGYSERAQLDGERLGEALQARLGRRVVGLAPVAEGRCRGEADDATPPRLGHVLLAG